MGEGDCMLTPVPASPSSACRAVRWGLSGLSLLSQLGDCARWVWPGHGADKGPETALPSPALMGSAGCGPCPRRPHPETART